MTNDEFQTRLLKLIEGHNCMLEAIIAKVNDFEKRLNILERVQEVNSLLEKS